MAEPIFQPLAEQPRHYVGRSAGLETDHATAGFTINTNTEDGAIAKAVVNNIIDCDAKRRGLPNTVRDAGAWVMFDGTPYAYLHICGTPWTGNEYDPSQIPIWTMRYGRPLET